jgi:hypothetical protein
MHMNIHANTNTLVRIAYFEIFLNKKLLSVTLRKSVQLHSGAQFS